MALLYLDPRGCGRWPSPSRTTCDWETLFPIERDPRYGAQRNIMQQRMRISLSTVLVASFGIALSPGLAGAQQGDSGSTLPPPAEGTSPDPAAQVGPAEPATQAEPGGAAEAEAPAAPAAAETTASGDTAASAGVTASTEGNVTIEHANERDVDRGSAREERRHGRAGRRQYDGPPTLLGGTSRLGGYGGLTVNYAEIGDESGALVGLEGALLLDHRLALGLAAHGWTRNQRATPDPVDGEPRRLELGYGGAVIRYGLFTDQLVHATVGGLVGGGGAVLRRDDLDGDDEVDSEDMDTFFIVEPQVTAEVNLTRWLRVGAQVGYRFTAGVGKLDYDEGDINGIGAGGHVQIGWF